MAINASTQWWVRTDGDNTNGGGFDSEISGAGTNYCDQASAQLSLTDLATSGAASTTLTSATGGFTSAMIGNCIRISSGTNFQTGYYFITARTDTNTVTLDRTPTSGGAGSSGVGKLGGAFLNIGHNLASSASGGASVSGITSPLAAGHVINLRGTGSNNPSSIDYAKPTGYWSFAAGNDTAGPVTLRGYNGRPLLEHGSPSYYSCSNWLVDSVCSKCSVNYGGAVWNGSLTMMNCKFDQAGYSANLAMVQAVYNSEFTNSGSQVDDGTVAISCTSYGGRIHNCVFRNMRGTALSLGSMASVTNCVFINNRYGVDLIQTSTSYYESITNCILYDNRSHAIRITGDQAMQAFLSENIIYGNGGTGIYTALDTVAINDRRFQNRRFRNAYGSNGANVSGFTIESDAITLTADPFTDAANEDFTLNDVAGGGALLKASALTLPGTATEVRNFRAWDISSGGGLIRVGTDGGIFG
jgi:hypothetical protein